MANFFNKKTLRKLRDKWGHEDETQSADFAGLEHNFARMMKQDDWILDDQTWNDLDMNRNFIKWNRTYSNPGQQELYNLLRILCFDEGELKRRGQLVSFFQLNQEPREKVQCLLNYVGREDYDSAAALLYQGVPELPKASSWVIPCLVGLAASFLSIPFLGVRSIMLIAIFFILNMVVHAVFGTQTQQAMPGIRNIARMLTAARELSRLNIAELGPRYNEFFPKVVDKCSAILKKNRALGMASGADPFGIMEYLQIILLSQERAFMRCRRDIEENAPALRTLYRRLGELDAFQSMASVKRTMMPCTKPSFTSEWNHLSAQEMGHPSLAHAVCNDLTLDGKGLVLTGSNMSGKSTFLRTVGVNQLLAQTFYFVKAKHYECSFFNVVTSISPSDDMEEGKSYYMAEAQALKRMIRVVDDESHSSLLIIDEIFRGTNPTERVAGASALLHYLTEHHGLVLVATHDVDITSRCAGQFLCFHFEENVSKEALSFDYKLKPGVLRKPNGIRILSYLGYPEEIVEEALETVREELPEENDSGN